MGGEVTRTQTGLHQNRLPMAILSLNNIEYNSTLQSLLAFYIPILGYFILGQEIDNKFIYIFAVSLTIFGIILIINPFQNSLLENDKIGIIWTLLFVFVRGFNCIFLTYFAPINPMQLCLIQRLIDCIIVAIMTFSTEIWVWPANIEYFHLLLVAIGFSTGFVFHSKAFSTSNLASASICWNSITGITFIFQALILGIKINFGQSLGILILFFAISGYQSFIIQQKEYNLNIINEENNLNIINEENNRLVNDLESEAL